MSSIVTRAPIIVLLAATMSALLSGAPPAPTASAAPVCSDVDLHLTSDYAYMVGSASFTDPDGLPQSGSTYRWVVDGSSGGSLRAPELLALAFDDTVASLDAEPPARAEGIDYVSGRWGRALSLRDGGVLAYPAFGNLDLEAGTIEMWIAARLDGDDPVYAERSHVLFHYREPGGEYVSIALSGESGVLYAGGRADGTWQSAYSGRASTRGWKAGEWHHVAYTYSNAGDSMRFYLDGVLVADTNEGRYTPPAVGGETLFIGGDPWGNAAAFAIDSVRTEDRILSPEGIAARAARTVAPRANEVWLDAASIAPGDTVAFAFTPSTDAGPGVPCRSAPVTYPGIPVFDASPPSTLLPAGANAFELTVRSVTPTTCGYSVGAALDYNDMTPFESGAGAVSHTTTVRGLDPDPDTVNEVYVRCAEHRDYRMHLRYRALSVSDPGFPRTGNLWGSWGFLDRPMADAARIDLWLGAHFRPDQIRELRSLNPAIRVLTSMNAVENKGLPDDYYLRDVNGRRVETWPGSYRLNLTKTHVAEHQARVAYQLVRDSDLTFDGVFIDNVFTTQSWQTRDIHGNPFQVDADEDGVADDPEAFDAAWKAGVFHELATIRELLPHAVLSGHAMNIAEDGIADTFNGISVGFYTADVIEGKRRFGDLWDYYASWLSLAREPRVTMIESSPPDELAYGYDYSPLDKVPASTLEFARTYYPYVRFGLAFTLLGDGYFAHEWGDTWHGNDWWYDELDFDLGRPLGPAARLDLVSGPKEELVDNGGFEEPLPGTWRLWANSSEGCEASLSRDTSDRVSGAASARAVVTATSGVDWHVDLAQGGRTWDAGEIYRVAFWAKADRPRNITLNAQKDGPDWRGYGLRKQVVIGTQWARHEVAFEATETTDDSRLQIQLGATTGTVWLDDVSAHRIGPEVYRRDYDNGVVLLNGSREPQSLGVDDGLARLDGNQAPRVDRIVDDADPAFGTTGIWTDEDLDSGQWQSTGPYYHDWGNGCRMRVGDAGEARWALPIDATDTYTVTAWWPAHPTAASWSAAVTYDVVANGKVIVSKQVDQRTGGDEWHVVGEVELAPSDEAHVRMTCAGSDPCVADAIHLRSAHRYNDGSPARVVELGAMDGIVLRRAAPPSIWLPFAEKPSGQ